MVRIFFLVSFLAPLLAYSQNGDTWSNLQFLELMKRNAHNYRPSRTIQVPGSVADWQAIQLADQERQQGFREYRSLSESELKGVGAALTAMKEGLDEECARGMLQLRDIKYFGPSIVKRMNEVLARDGYNRCSEEVLATLKESFPARKMTASVQESLLALLGAAKEEKLKSSVMAEIALSTWYWGYSGFTERLRYSQAMTGGKHRKLWFNPKSEPLRDKLKELLNQKNISEDLRKNVVTTLKQVENWLSPSPVLNYPNSAQDLASFLDVWNRS